MNATGSTPQKPLGDANEAASALESSGVATKFRLRLKPTPGDYRWLLALAVFTVAALLGARPLQRELTLFLVLRSDGPSDTVLAELADQSQNRARTLERMWRSGNLAAREFVLNYDYLSPRLAREPALFNRLEPIIQDAARDPDLKVRESALTFLARYSHPEALALIRSQLNDADPAVRVMALQQLQPVADSNDVPTAIRLLNDSDPRVVVQASVFLRKVTGFDSGIRTSDALPYFTRSEDGAPSPEPNPAAIHPGMQRWREWWSSNRAEFPKSLPLPPIPTLPLPVNDFTLEDLNGRPVRLSDFRGKAVLLWFWKTGDARSFDDLAALKQLQRQNQRLAVVGVAYDPTVGPQDECAEEMRGKPMMMNGRMMIMDASPGPIESVVRDVVAQRQIPFPVLVDKKGTAAYRFNVQELPAYALIDSEGRLCRRFAGSRSLEVFKAMVEEVEKSPATLVAAR